MMKILGIDYGTKRVGIAVTDGDRKMAFPKYVLTNDQMLCEKIGKICESEDIKEIVIGQSLNLNREPNQIMSRIEELKKKLEKELGVKVYFEDESFTTVEASRIQGQNDMVDASAAALILRSFIEKNTND